MLREDRRRKKRNQIFHSLRSSFAKKSKDVREITSKGEILREKQVSLSLASFPLRSSL